MLGNIDTENILRFKTISTHRDGNCFFFNSLKKSFNSQYPDNQDNVSNIYSEEEMRKQLAQLAKTNSSGLENKDFQEL